jgi:hypothetical protein
MENYTKTISYPPHTTPFLLYWSKYQIIDYSWCTGKKSLPDLMSMQCTDALLDFIISSEQDIG